MLCYSLRIQSRGPRNQGGCVTSRKWNRQGNQFSPSPADTLILADRDPRLIFDLKTSKIEKKNCVVLSHYVFGNLLQQQQKLRMRQRVREGHTYIHTPETQSLTLGPIIYHTNLCQRNIFSLEASPLWIKDRFYSRRRHNFWG